MFAPLLPLPSVFSTQQPGVAGVAALASHPLSLAWYLSGMWSAPSAPRGQSLASGLGMASMHSHSSPPPPFKVHTDFAILDTEGGVMCLVSGYWLSLVTLDAVGRVGDKCWSWFPSPYC